jgi:hypothetical protein
MTNQQLSTIKSDCSRLERIEELLNQQSEKQNFLLKAVFEVARWTDATTQHKGLQRALEGLAEECKQKWIEDNPWAGHGDVSGGDTVTL